MQTIGWRPQPRQQLFQNCPAFEAMYGGAKGGGKSDALLAESTRQINHPRYKALILRRTFPKLQEIIDRSHRWFHGWAKWNSQQHRWTWPSGASLTFGHCKSEDDKYNYQGHEYQFIGLDQLEEFTRSIYLFMMAQCRTSVKELMCYIRSTANPCGIGHAWVKERFIDKLNKDGKLRWFKTIYTPQGDVELEVAPFTPGALSRAFVFAKVYDNPALVHNDPGYVSRLEQLPDKLRRALLEGDWDAFEGQFFEEWRRDIHVIPFREWVERKQAMPVKRILGLDYGYTAPSSVGWYGLFPDDRVVRYKELYVEKHTYRKLGEKILERCVDEEGKPEEIDYCSADPAIWGDRKHHDHEPKDGEARGESGFDVLNDVMGDKIPIVRGDNRRVVGWNRAREYLAPFRDQHDEITARFQVTENCRNFIRTITGLIHDDNNPEDVDTTGEDHPQDEWRYALMTRPALPAMPVKPKSSAEEFWDRVKVDQARSHSEGSVGEDLELGEDEYEITEDGATYIGE